MKINKYLNEEDMPVSKTLLEDDFLKHYHISEVHKNFTGGQKNVFILTKEGRKCVLKLFHNFGIREERELDIYNEFKNINGIPKMILREKYQDDVVVFEEYIEGDLLQDVLKKFTADFYKIRKLFLEICDIMEPIWSKSITHRDLNPRNIIIRPNGSPVIIDFGIARNSALDSLTVTGTGLMPRTRLYGAPEQYKGLKDQISYRTDFFSLTVIAYNLYYVRFPFGDNADEVEKKYNNSDLTYLTDKNCNFNKLFNEVFKINPSERPRNLESLKELLK